MIFPSLFLRPELLIKKPPGGTGLLPGGTGFVITTWNGTCSLPAPATVIFFFASDQTRFSDSILSSARTFFSAGAAHTVKLSEETVLALTLFAPVFSWPYILSLSKNNCAARIKKNKILVKHFDV